MKKLEKNSLIQLAEVMPVICENEQKCCVGGTDYFANTSSGIKYLGHISDSHDEVRFTDCDSFNQSGSNPADLYDNSQSLAQIQSNTGNNISAISIANAYCTSNAPSVDTTFQSVVTCNGQTVQAKYSYTNDMIYLDTEDVSSYITDGNFSEFRSVFTHEYAHSQTYSTIENDIIYNEWLSSDQIDQIHELAGLAAQINQGVPESYKSDEGSFKQLCNRAVSSVYQDLNFLAADDLDNYNTVNDFYTNTWEALGD